MRTESEIDLINSTNGNWFTENNFHKYFLHTHFGQPNAEPNAEPKRPFGGPLVAQKASKSGKWDPLGD